MYIENQKSIMLQFSKYTLLKYSWYKTFLNR